VTVAVLDTNALMMPVECGVRVFEELDRLLGGPELLVPAAVLGELESLSAGAGEAAAAASVGRDLADRCTVRATEAEYADDAVLELAQQVRAREPAPTAGSGAAPGGDRDGPGPGTGAGAGDAGATYAVTNDRELRERLREAGVPVICLRGQDKLAIT
jgi:hypothetical protein